MSTNILGKSKFIDWLVETRTKKGMTHDKVAENSNGGISSAYVGFLESGKKTAADFTLKKLIALAIGLKIAPQELLKRALEDELKRVYEIEVLDLGKADRTPKNQQEADEQTKIRRKKTA